MEGFDVCELMNLLAQEGRMQRLLRMVSCSCCDIRLWDSSFVFAAQIIAGLLYRDRLSDYWLVVYYDT